MAFQGLVTHMTGLAFGFMTEPQMGGSYAELLELAQWAERVGFDVFARSDHYLDSDRSAEATDALTTLAGLARETERIRLAVLVSPLTFRHPAVLAKSAATIDQMSGGRLDLGVGTGWMESEHERFGMDLPDLGTRFARLEETLRYLTAAFGRAPGGFEGDHYRLDSMAVLPGPTGQLPLIVGGSGRRRTPRLAGRYAGEYNLFTTDQTVLAPRIEEMRTAAVAAERDPDAVVVSVVGSPIVGADRDEYEQRLGEVALARSIDIAALRASLEDRQEVHGTVDQARTRLEELSRAGVRRFYLQVDAPLHAIDTAVAARTLNLLRSA
jgi:alkanesulfonate monooxygenase SsuD/methylene tetrahydromethanopterin reductase-like flavin-dependent oxidoreductase (luciferase family)